MQIANILFSEGIPTPTEYWQSKGRKTSALPAVPHKWAARTVADILERQEYIGDTVNFRSTTRSFKDKTKIELPKEEWKVFESTHEAIIDRETWEIVQTLRENKRRPNRTDEVSIFSGLLYCGDCGEKLYYSVTNNYSREQAYFFCSNYRKNTANCTAHYIREKVVYSLVVESLRRILFYVQAFEKHFVREQLEKSSKEQKKELTPAIVNEFIDHILVSKKQVIDGKTVYPIDIYYNGVGIINAPSAEEYEEMFQERLK